VLTNYTSPFLQLVAKSISHHVKMRSIGITSGTKLKVQKQALDEPVDIIVSTPGRFMQHLNSGWLGSTPPLHPLGT